MANLPTGIINNISFGPARVFMKEWTNHTTSGGSPTVDVGFIGEDGVSLEIGSEKKAIRQGNPALINYQFTQQQSCTISFSSIEWEFENIQKALGSGKYVNGTATCYLSFSFGGDPLNKSIGVMVKHEMAVSSNTLWIYGWKMQSDAGFTAAFGQDEMNMEYTFQALRADKDWGDSAALSYEEKLFAIRRMLTTNQKNDGTAL